MDCELRRRLRHLDRILELDYLNRVEIWLGGLFFPESYATDTTQAVARRKRWGLETLRMHGY